MLNALHRWCLTLLLALADHGLSLEIQNLEWNPGIVPMKIGTAVIRNHQWTFYKAIELDTIRIQLENNLHEYTRLKDIINKQCELRRLFLGT